MCCASLVSVLLTSACLTSAPLHAKSRTHRYMCVGLRAWHYILSLLSEYSKECWGQAFVILLLFSTLFKVLLLVPCVDHWPTGGCHNTLPFSTEMVLQCCPACVHDTSPMCIPAGPASPGQQASWGCADGCCSLQRPSTASWPTCGRPSWYAKVTSDPNTSSRGTSRVSMG